MIAPFIRHRVARLGRIWFLPLMAAGILLFSSCGGDYLFIGEPPASTDNQADFVIEGLRMTITRGGQTIQELNSDNAVLRATRGVIEMDDVTVHLYNDNNEVEGRLVADEGVVYITENYDRNKNDVDLSGQVNYESVDGTFFRTERVNFYNERDIVESDTPVEQGRLSDNMQITMTGSGFQSDRRFREIKTFGAKMRIGSAAAAPQ